MPTSAHVPISPDILRDVADPKAALTAARAEARALERQLAGLARKGETISEDIAKQLAAAQSRVKSLETLRGRERQLYRNQRELREFGSFTKAIVGGQLARKIAGGQAPGMGDIAQVGFVFEHEIVQELRRSFGRKMAGTLGRTLRAVPFIGEAVDAWIDAVGKITQNAQTARAFGAAHGRGKASQEAYDAVMGGGQQWFKLGGWDIGWFAGKRPEDIAALGQHGAAAMQLPMDALAKALKPAEEYEVQRTYAPGVGMGGFGPVAVGMTRRVTTSAEELAGRVNTAWREKVAGLARAGLDTPENVKAAFGRALQQVVGAEHAAEVAEEIGKALGERPQIPERMAHEQFRQWDDQRRTHLEIARRAIPAKLED